MVTRRTILQAGIGLPLGMSLASCAPRKDLAKMTSSYEEGMYLAGNFGPVSTEQTLTELNVTGQIPRELVGRFLRNGPNPIGDVNTAKHHWFIGDGMVHGVRLEDGRADWYRNRWVRSTDVAEKLGEKAGSLPMGSPNTHVIGHGGRTWAIVESGTPPVELSYELDTLSHSANWGSYTAHPKLDPDTGELHAICYDWANLRDHIRYVVIDEDANEAESIDIPMNGMPMIHDMSLTQNYVVLFDLPVTLDFTKLATGYFPMSWDNDYEPRVGLLPRNGTASDIIWSPISPCYAYHPMNAYENDAGDVVIDICRYEKMFAMDVNGPFGDSLPRLDRWTINPSLAKVSEETVDERPQEFPRVHPALNSKAHRYGYAVQAEGTHFPAIIKHDMQTGTTESLEFGAGRHGAEPVFVPRESAASEDDGFLMTYVYDESKNASELLIADALDLARGAIARVDLPRVPYGFHGSWIPDSDT
jgi:8'-apo-carotenoid 13,14-cleaving dioxygenase